MFILQVIIFIAIGSTLAARRYRPIQPLHNRIVVINAQPQPQPPPEPPHEPQYRFQYLVHDQNSGDFKEHSETRKDGNVVGYYSFIEPDGRRRIVHYNANDNGFNAIVTHEVGKRLDTSGYNDHQDGRKSSGLEATMRYLQSRQANSHHINAISHVVFEAPEYSYKYSN